MKKMILLSIKSLDSVLVIEKHKIKNLTKQIDSFDFQEQDIEHINTVVYGIDNELSDLARSLYRLRAKLNEIDESLSEEIILFKPNNVEKLFKETGIFFKDNLKKSYEDLIAFNKAITSERIEYMKKERVKVIEEIKLVSDKQKLLSAQRSENMSYLSDPNPFKKLNQLRLNFINQKKIIQTQILSTEDISSLCNNCPWLLDDKFISYQYRASDNTKKMINIGNLNGEIFVHYNQAEANHGLKNALVILILKNGSSRKETLMGIDLIAEQKQLLNKITKISELHAYIITDCDDSNESFSANMANRNFTKILNNNGYSYYNYLSGSQVHVTIATTKNIFTK